MIFSSNQISQGAARFDRFRPFMLPVFAMSLLAACSHDSAPGTVTDTQAEPDVELDTSVPDDTTIPGPETISFDIGPADTNADTSTGPNCEVQPFAFFCPCDINSQCASGFCIQANDDQAAQRCSQACQEDCPNGWECRGLSLGGDPVFVCQPPIQTLCNACERDADCRNVGARCIDYDDGKYCGQSCSMASDLCPSGFRCEEITNELGQTISTQCVRTSGSCNCPDGTDYQNDPNNCGVCGNYCNFFGSVPTCQTGTCVLGPCRESEGFWNLNGIATDGCEYECNFVGNNDEPDAVCNGSSCDQNCDGIDGSYDLGIFVSESGAANGTGTATSPMNSIPAAITKAAQTGKPHVYVTSGTFIGEITMREGVSVYGGYSNDGKWQRNLSAHKTILTNSSGTNSIRVVIADGIGAGRTVLDGVEVNAGNNVNPGGSSYAIWARNVGANVIFRNLTAVGGNGGAGTVGQSGTPGSAGQVGNPGTQGNTDWACDDEAPNSGKGGAGGGNNCSRGNDPRGGAGGRSGCDKSSASDEPRPQAGSNSPGGALGGAAPANVGQPGSAGSGGRNGAGGTPATGEVVSAFWRGFAGEAGNDGANGIGGGGGGGSHGGIGGILTGYTEWWGGGGGGGGSGGCGGTGGAGGGPGGGSFGAFFVNASPTLIDVRLGHKNGGAGGAGGQGGAFGEGRDGGIGGKSYQASDTAGGKGGRGGNGGVGGHGGGGAGGVAYALYASGGSAPSCTNVLYTAPTAGGQGGNGGAAGGTGGNRGSDGAFGPRNADVGTCR